MRSWDILPYEILLHVFDQLYSLSDVSACQRTCLNWSRAAQERLYREVTVHKIPALNAFMSALSMSKNDSGQYVKSLSMHLMPPNSLGSDFLDRLAQSCPNIEELYSQWNSELWKDLVGQHDKGHFEFLKTIDFPTTTVIYKDYIAAMFAFRQNTKTLFLMNDLPSFNDREENIMPLYNQLAQNLNQFPSLTDFNVKIQTDDNLLALDLLIDDCSSSLRSVMFTAYESRGRSARLRPVLHKNLSLVRPLPNINKFHGEGIYFTNECIQYLMHKFPHLKSLIMNVVGEGLDGRASVFELSTDGEDSVMSKFFHYISVIPSFEISGTVEDAVLPDTMDLYKKILGDNLTIRFEYSDFRGRAAYPFMKFHKTSIQYFAPKRTTMGNPKDKSAQNNIMEVHYFLDEDLLELPHLDFIKQYAGSIKEISIRTGFKSKESQLLDSGFDLAMMYQSLQVILTECPLIEALVLNEMNFVRESASNERFAEVALPLGLRNDSLQILIIQKSSWYTESVLCQRLSQCLPSLKYLVFEDCDFVIEEGRSTKKNKKNLIKIDMPETNFENIRVKLSYGSSHQQLNSGVFYLQVNDHRGEAYYMVMFGRDTIPLPISFDIFDAWTKKGDMNWFMVNCKSIKTFTLECHGANSITFVNPPDESYFFF